MGLIKFIKKLKRKKDCMLDGNTIVHVLGTIDARDNMWDFSEVCTLDESLNIAIKQFRKNREEHNYNEKSYYSIVVCYGVECIYTIDIYGIRISEPYKDIVSFKNLDLSDIRFIDVNKFFDENPDY